MKFTHQLAAIILGVIILAESVGVQIVRDICLPCDFETITVQFALDDYKPDASHDSQVVAHHPGEEENCSCNPVQCCNHEHQHQKEIQVVTNYPDFFGSAPNIVFSSPTFYLSAIINKQEALFAIEWFLYPLFQLRFNPVDPNTDRQSLLCSYLI